MNRRGFLQALFAVPVIAAPLLIPAAVDLPKRPAIGKTFAEAQLFSELPKTYAGRLDWIYDAYASGLIDIKGARRLLMEMPR